MYERLLLLILLLGTETLQEAVAYRRFHAQRKASNPLITVQCDPWRQKKMSMKSMTANIDTSYGLVDVKHGGRDFLKTIWNFSRPHTIVGSAVSIVALFMFSVSPSLWMSKEFLSALTGSIVPSIFMNLYITGLNQITDVEIDKINKPYLPIASGALTYKSGIVIVICSLLASVLTSWGAKWPLLFVLLGSFLLGTIYSIPPFRLKRFPLLAAICIFVVRGTLVNLGFIWQAKKAVGNIDGGPLHLLSTFPESLFLTAFFAVYGLVIAILKDVPDIDGDKEFSIMTFSVKWGAHRTFKLSCDILTSLLVSASMTNAWIFISSAISRGSVGWMNTLGSTLFSTLMIYFALDLNKKASNVHETDKHEVYSFYMDVWKIFYACYLSLPLLHSIT